MLDPEYHLPQPSVTQALRIKTRQRRQGGLPRPLKPLLDLLQIVAWADEHYARTGAWPNVNSGAVFASSGEKWQAIDLCLRRGHRGLRAGSSLARLLEQHRGVRNIKNLPPLTHERVLAWADAHHQAMGEWPIAASGPIAAAPGETWMAVDAALWGAGRGLPGGESLARLLAARRGVRNTADLPPLTEPLLLAWADAHHHATGQWPNLNSGPILGAPGETWGTVDQWLRAGGRGLPCGSSLARLLEARRSVRNTGDLAPLTEVQILAWADAHYVRTGRWPTRTGGSIPTAPGETWKAVNAALCNGNRGLPGGATLARLLRAHCFLLISNPRPSTK
jgi:hypothetical protein